MITAAPASAADLARLINGYYVEHPDKVVIPKVSTLASLQAVTVSGTLIPWELSRFNADGKTRNYKVENNGVYKKQDDGDIHFCLGTAPSAFHVPCELQHGALDLAQINANRNRRITVRGFLRCMFEHPGFGGPADAHIFEIHPVTGIDFGNGCQKSPVGIPDVVHSWTTPNDLNKEDDSVSVDYANDVLTFTLPAITGNPMRLDTNYVRLTGKATALAHAGGPSAQFTFTCPEVKRKGKVTPLRVLCVADTHAGTQTAGVDGRNIELVALRHIDLDRAKQGEYVINLVGIDIKKV